MAGSAAQQRAPRASRRGLVGGVLLVLAVAIGSVAVAAASAGAGERTDAGEPTGTGAGQPTGGGGGERTGAGVGELPPDPTEEQLVTAGEQLYLTGCVSCHAVGGVGTTNGPSLQAAGAAAADFYLRTGRMPLNQPTEQAPEKPVAYTDAEIEALVAYVATLGEGPPIPEVDLEGADLAAGGELYLSNCAPCHNSAGIGGALSYGQHAPSLWDVQATQIAEAMRIGPGEMPVFGPETFSDDQVDDIVRYVLYLQDPEKPGGLQLGGAGPVPEGFVAWVVGIGVLVLFIRWITRHHA